MTLLSICESVIDENPDKVNTYRLGKKALLGLFTGLVVKKCMENKIDVDPQEAVNNLTTLLDR